MCGPKTSRKGKKKAMLGAREMGPRLEHMVTALYGEALVWSPALPGPRLTAVSGTSGRKSGTAPLPSLHTPLCPSTCPLTCLLWLPWSHVRPPAPPETALPPFTLDTTRPVGNTLLPSVSGHSLPRLHHTVTSAVLGPHKQCPGSGPSPCFSPSWGCGLP